MADPRGDPWDHDPGPGRSSGWPELFAATPNYRGLGRAITGREEFRWHFGPIFYRGRLDGSARVLVVGQEGAQDESLSHRSFTGGTGARLQHLLRHLGIGRSYLFLNTFVYPIFGQYTDALRGLGQNPASPIVQHRNRLFDQAAEGDLRLVIAVGQAAKESLATWLSAHGCPADPAALHRATCGGALSGVRFLGVLHPGGIGSSGGGAAIRADFARAANQVRDWVDADADWLPPDPGSRRDLTRPFVYGSTPVPYADFAFGTSPRLGRGATSSNRGDEQRSIQLFSAAGRYNGAGADLDYTDRGEGTTDGYSDEPGDLPVEPPRRFPRRFDPGPPAGYARLLAGGEPGFGWPDFAALGVTAHPSFGTGPVHRGRVRPISLVVLTDPDAPDDVFTGRAACGERGQWLQALLTAAGLTTRYLIVRTVPVDTTGLSAARRRALVDHPAVRAFHTELLRRLRADNDGLAALIAVGPGAQQLAASAVAASMPVIDLPPWSPAARGAWQAGLDRLAELTYRTDLGAPSFRLPAGRGRVPPGDLPFGTPLWIGTSGNRGSRPIDRRTGRPSPDYLKLYVPRWVYELDPPPLSPGDAVVVPALRPA